MHTESHLILTPWLTFSWNCPKNKNENNQMLLSTIFLVNISKLKHELIQTKTGIEDIYMMSDHKHRFMKKYYWKNCTTMRAGYLVSHQKQHNASFPGKVDGNCGIFWGWKSGKFCKQDICTNNLKLDQSKNHSWQHERPSAMLPMLLAAGLQQLYSVYWDHIITATVM